MAPFVTALDAFHDKTRPGTWLEGLVKAYVGDGLAADFYREVAAFLPEPDRALVEEVLADTGQTDFAVREVRAAIAENQKLVGRLSLWARRLVGEAISQSQAVLAEHDRLTELIVAGIGDLAGIGRLVARITEGHAERMRRLGSRFIAFDRTAFWWLDHYRGFTEHLRTSHSCVRDSDQVVIFELGSPQ